MRLSMRTVASGCACRKAFTTLEYLVVSIQIAFILSAQRSALTRRRSGGWCSALLCLPVSFHVIQSQTNAVGTICMVALSQPCGETASASAAAPAINRIFRMPKCDSVI